MTNSVCGVLLFEEAYTSLGEAITPYVKEGQIGKFIYCQSACQNGHFMDMTFSPEQCNGTVVDTMIISVPLHFVKFVASGKKELPIGFLPKR